VLLEIAATQEAAGYDPAPALEAAASVPAPTPTPAAEEPAPATPLPLESSSELDLSGIDIRIYDAKAAEERSTSALALVRTTAGPPSSDATVEELFSGMAMTAAFYRDVFGRNSIDGRGSPLESIVHYGQAYNNSFWDGERLVVGDGDGTIFLAFSRPEMIAHKLSHIVTGQMGVVFQGQSGAISESFCDVIGMLVKQWGAGQTAAESDWLLGAGLLGPGINGVALRSLRSPGTAYDDPQLGKDPQPATMDGYVMSEADNGGVHVNCGIPQPGVLPGGRGAGRVCMGRRREDLVPHDGERRSLA
jgi:Zn-dependent metalloprotease